MKKSRFNWIKKSWVIIFSLIAFLVGNSLNSPVLIDFFFGSKVKYKVRKAAGGVIVLEIANSGHEPTSSLAIEISPRGMGEYERVNIKKVGSFPAKECTILPVGYSTIVKFKTPILIKENVAVFIYADIPNPAYETLFLEVTYDGKVAHRLIEYEYGIKIPLFQSEKGQIRRDSAFKQKKRIMNYRFVKKAQGIRGAFK